MDPIKLYLVGGFLGSGKTTFLTALMNDLSGQRLGVIVNEFGAISIDGLVLERDGVKMVEINNGSIFCACLKDGFVRTLKAFAEQPIDILLIENSGMADPAGMKTILKGLAPYLQRQYDYQGLICLVDCTTFLDYVDILTPVQSQVAEADYIIVNKTDLADQLIIDDIHGWIRELNSSALVYDTVYAQIPLPLPERKPTDKDSGRISANTPQNRPAGFVLETDSEPEEAALRAFCEALADSTLRIKGFTRRAGAWLHTDSVGKQVAVGLAKDIQDLSLRSGKLVIICLGNQDQQAKIARAWEAHCGNDYRLTQS